MPEELIASTIIFRDHQHGTWFVQSLVEVFMTHAHDTELVCLPRLTVCFPRFILQNIQVDLLRMTSERLSHFTNEQGEKQTCNVEMRSDQDIPVFLPLICQAIVQDKEVSVFLPLVCQALVQGQDVFFYLLPPRHLYKRIYFNPGLGGGPQGADLITREQSMEQ